MPDPHVDLANFEHHLKGDRTLIREWIQLYLQESPESFQQRSASLENGDGQALANAAHDLQPQTHQPGSTRMLELLAAVEEQALGDDTHPCGDLLNALLPTRDAIDADLRGAEHGLGPTTRTGENTHCQG